MARPPEAQIRVEKEFGKSVKELMQEFYIEKNMHSSELATIFKVSPQTIVRWCHMFGIEVKPKGGRIEVPTSSYPKIIEFYNKGKTSTEIADMFNCSDCTITQILNDNDVEIRGPRERFERKYSLDERYFQNIDTPMKAYFLGWAMSDGCVIYDTDGSRYTLKIKADDVEVIEEFKKQLNYDGPIRTETNKRKYPAKRVSIYSATFVEDLMSHGVIPNKSTTMTKPIGVPTELEGHFLRGYFDGDGSVTIAYKGAKTLKIEYCGNISMMEWIAERIEKHTGIPKNKVCARNSYFATLSYAGAKIPIIRDFMYSSKDDFGLKRKKDRLFSI